MSDSPSDEQAARERGVSVEALTRPSRWALERMDAAAARAPAPTVRQPMRICRWSGGIWYTDRYGCVHQGVPPVELLADPTVVIDEGDLQRFGLLRADFRTHAELLAALNRALAADPDAPTAEDAEPWRVPGVAVALIAGLVLWTALILAVQS